MKRILVSILSVLVVFSLFGQVIKADGISFSGSTSVSVYEGASTSIKVTISNGAGRVNVSSSNTNVASVNVSSQWVDSSSMTFTIKGVKAGTATVTISGTWAGYSDTKDHSFSRTITVKVYEKTSPNVPSGTAEPTKSSVKLLGSLSIEGLKFEEEFNSSRTEYTVYAPNGTEKVNIKATAASSKATLSSIATDVVEGWNEISFTCTAEDGSKQAYKIRIYVEEKPDIYFNDNKYGVVKNLDKVKAPEGFEEEKITIEDKEATIFTSKGINLIYLADEENNKDFYIYEKETNSILCLYKPVEFDGKKYIALDFNYDDFSYLDEQYMHSYTYIDNVRYETWTSRANNMNEFRLLYLLDEEGNKILYSYDLKEKTMQRFILPVYPVVTEEKTFWQQYQNQIGISAAVAGISSLLLAIIISIKNARKIKHTSK